MATALITGGCNPFGLVAAESLAADGYEVVATTRSSERAREWSERDAFATCRTLNPTDPQAVRKVVGDIADLAVLINAAVARFPVKNNEDYTWQDWSQELEVNLGAAYQCSVVAARTMRARGAGRIINIGSIYGSVAVDHGIYPEGMAHAHIVYSVSKAGLLQMTRELASMYAADGITVNMLSFGGIEAGQPAEFQRRYSRKVPVGRLGRYDELGPALRMLAAPANSYMTGQNIMVDGGLTAW